MVTVGDLTESTRSIFDGQGFVPCNGSQADQECQAVLDDRFRELAADRPEQGEVELHLTQLLDTARLGAPRGPLDFGPKLRAWVVTERIFLPERSDFPYHHTREQMARFAIRTAADRALHLRAAGGLVLETRALPQVVPGRGIGPSVGAGFAHHVSVNGNHRAAIFRTLHLPVVPAYVTACTETRWAMRHTAWLVAELERCGLLEYVGSGLTFDADALIGWVCSVRAQEGPAQIVARLARLESLIGPTVSPARGLLSSRWLLELARLRNI